jgi:hypothetical protein
VAARYSGGLFIEGEGRSSSVDDGSVELQAHRRDSSAERALEAFFVARRSHAERRQAQREEEEPSRLPMVTFGLSTLPTRTCPPVRGDAEDLFLSCVLRGETPSLLCATTPLPPMY